MKKLVRTLSFLCAVLMIVSLVPITSLGAGSARISVDNDYAQYTPTGKSFYVPHDYDFSNVDIVVSADSYSVGSSEKKEYKQGTPIDITDGKTTDNYGNDCWKVTFYKDGSYNNYTFYKLSEIPTVYVETSMGINYINQNKNNRDKNSQVIIVDENGESVYNDETAETFSEIKGRGNATSGYSKKPYQIKLGKKTDLFGMGKAKTWILLANYIDSSFIRNAVSYEIADSFGLAFTPKSKFVNLFIDGQFIGLYQLIEKTQIGSNRIDIEDLEDLNDEVNEGVDLDSLPRKTVSSGDFIENSKVKYYTYIDGVKDPDDITGGYLVEMDNLYASAEKCMFQTDNGNVYVVKSPECASQAQMEYISKLVSDMEDAIYSDDGYNYLGKHYSDYCDVDSLLKVYMTLELTQNWDAYIGSTFFYKDADHDGEVSKIYGGPVWDYDNTFGNLDKDVYLAKKEDLWAQGTNIWACWNYGVITRYVPDFGFELANQPDVAERLEQLYKQGAEKMMDMLSDGGYIDQLTELIYDSVSADKSVWKTSRPSGFKTFNNYTDDEMSENCAVGYLEHYMLDRIVGLKYEFVSDPDNYDPTAPAQTEESTSDTTPVASVEPDNTSSGDTFEPSDTTTTGENESGCKSALGAVAVIPVVAICLVFSRKKKED